MNIRDASCQRARQELATGDGTTDVATGFDVSWMQKGWTTNEGFVSAILQKTAEVLDVHHFAINCRLRSRYDDMVRKGMSKMKQLKNLTMHSSCLPVGKFIMALHRAWIRLRTCVYERKPGEELDKELRERDLEERIKGTAGHDEKLV